MTCLVIQRPLDLEGPSGELGASMNDNADERWNQIKGTMHFAAGFAYGSRSDFHQRLWIS